jgi:hypothetical protein
MTNNTIVKEIHGSFSVAEEELLQEARSILEESQDEKKKKRAEQLSRIGFGSAKPVKRVSKEEQERAEKLLHLKQRYSRVAPQYKFITEEKLLAICEKYGLVVGSSERYVEDIPAQNQEDIMNFKILDEAFLEVSDDRYRNAVHTTKDGKEMHPKDMSTSHIEYFLTFMQRKLSRDHRGAYMSMSAVDDIPVTLIRAMITELTLREQTDAIEEQRKLWKNSLANVIKIKTLIELFNPIKSTYFYVAADVDSFNTEGVTLEGNQLVEQNNDKELEESMKQDLFRYYDPIVLAKVQGGYLIVTAWGDEASDPDVANPTRN